MIVIVRQTSGAAPANLVVAMSRETPPYADAGIGIDYFCEATQEQVAEMEAAGHLVVRLRDGWYEAGTGGMAIWGNGRHFELRDTPFTIAGPSERPR